VTALEAEKADDSTLRGWKLGVRARLLLAFFGISGFAVLAAAAGIYAFRQVGDRLELIDARVPQVVSSMEISRAADRLIASAPALLAATTTKEHDEISNRMRPEFDRLIIGLNDIAALRYTQ
jgi:phosphoglycerate-specific signal transduction histidine kinase